MSTQDRITAAAISEAAKTMGAAVAAQERAKGAVWAGVRKAAEAFPPAMTELDRKVLSGALAKRYAAAYGTEASAKVVASQHAKAIYLLATHAKAADGSPVDADEASDVQSYLKAHRAPVAAAGAVVRAEDAKPVAMSTAGLPVETGAAIVRLIEAAKRDPEIADALIFASNNLDEFPAFVGQIIDKKQAVRRAQRVAAPVGGITATAAAMQAAQILALMDAKLGAQAA